MIVVDTSVLINLFRGIQSLSTTKLKNLESGMAPFCIPALCCQELLQGAKNQKEWDLLHVYLSSQEILYPTSEFDTYKGAAKIYFDLWRKGLSIRSTIDCFIAQQVLELKNGVLLHDDHDFDHITKYFQLSCL